MLLQFRLLVFVIFVFLSADYLNIYAVVMLIKIFLNMAAEEAIAGPVSVFVKQVFHFRMARANYYGNLTVATIKDRKSVSLWCIL